MRKVFKIIIILVIIVIAAAAAAGVFILKMNETPENMPEDSSFRVERGDTTHSIAENLMDEGLIRNDSFFILYSRLMNTSGLMKSGIYRIDGGMSTVEIHNKLLEGSEELFSVTIPPGLSSPAVAEILEKEGITDADAFNEAVESAGAEGLLFPDTYNFPKDYPAEKTVKYMLETFYQSLEIVYPDYQSLSDEDFREKIVMASIIEREYRNEDEAALMASVFYNRIDENMYLGSCATVVYVITEELGREHPERLLYRDLELVSPYNTYRNKGLPPGAICNPGITALDAAFNPESTDYLYFLLEDPETGRHSFSRSLSEHNRSYELYIKGK